MEIKFPDLIVDLIQYYLRVDHPILPIFPQLARELNLVFPWKICSSCGGDNFSNVSIEKNVCHICGPTEVEVDYLVQVKMRKYAYSQEPSNQQYGRLLSNQSMILQTMKLQKQLFWSQQAQEHLVNYSHNNLR